MISSDGKFTSEPLSFSQVGIYFIFFLVIDLNESFLKIVKILL